MLLTIKNNMRFLIRDFNIYSKFYKTWSQFFQNKQYFKIHTIQIMANLSLLISGFLARGYSKNPSLLWRIYPNIWYFHIYSFLECLGDLLGAKGVFVSLLCPGLIILHIQAQGQNLRNSASHIVSAQ